MAETPSMLTEAEARALLALDNHTAEFYATRVRARRRLQPVTTAAERAANRAYLQRTAVARTLERARAGNPP